MAIQIVSVGQFALIVLVLAFLLVFAKIIIEAAALEATIFAMVMASYGSILAIVTSIVSFIAGYEVGRRKTNNRR